MKSGKIIVGNLRSNGYVKINLILNGVNTSVLYHKIICRTFHGIHDDPTYTVDHIDRVKSNNMPSNLRWASKQEQSFNRGPNVKQGYMIAEIIDDKIIDFYEYQSILEIFDEDQVIIPNEGLYRYDRLWIYENFTNLDMLNEIWAPIIVENRIINVSNMGRVQLSRTPPASKSFGSNTGNGYKSKTIGDKKISVHILVLTAFRGNYNNRLVVNHMDRDKTNNRLENLEVVTPSENTIHAFETGSKTLKPVEQLSKDGIIIASFPSIKKASDATGISRSSICGVANGQRKTAGDFFWRFI